MKVIGLVLLIAIAALFFGYVLPSWARDVRTGLGIVSNMEACIKAEKTKGHGQDHLDSTYRLCWMRAGTDASK